MATEEQMREVKRRHSRQLLALPGVCGVGIEKGPSGEYMLSVHLDANDPEAGADVPSTIEGHQVNRVRSGPFQRLGAQSD